jgi:hypothetical protein
MTTVDVYIQEESGGAHLLSFHNGLSGPATEVKLAVYEALAQGHAVDAGNDDSLVPGGVLRRILTEARMDGPDYASSATPEQLRRFLETVLRDERTYRVTCIEF